MVNKHKILENMQMGTIAETANQKYLVKSDKCFDSPVLLFNGLKDKEIAETYWLLDQNAFGGSQSAPIFMKLDTLTLGGFPIMLMLPNEIADPELKKQIKAEKLPYVPIGFIDMHHVAEGIFATSGLGIAKQYQGIGLSKYLVYGAALISGLETLIIPTQLSNAPAHHSWLHLAPLEIMCADVFHNELDSIVYKAHISNPEKILESKKKGKITGHLLPFSEVKSIAKKKQLYVIGYDSEKGGLIIK